MLIDQEKYNPNVRYQWDAATIENHLMNLEWYNLIKAVDNKYELTFPILKKSDIANLEQFILQFANNWIKVILDTKEHLQKAYTNLDYNQELLEILIEKAVEKLYELLKEQNLLPNEPNLKVLWAEQIRAIKFEEWVRKTF